jgi:hypothetical protein
MYTWADKIKGPTVILKGEQSKVVSDNGLQDFIKAVPITVVLKVDGPHSFPMTIPAVAGDAIRMGMDILLRETAPRTSSTT